MPVINVENISKKYRIGLNKQTNPAKNNFIRTITSPFNYLFDTLRPLKEEEIFWALKDISFDVQQGDVVGIIGKNGAGKSTLLKILSRITEPTSGRAIIKGRVGSLLEVGTGFHPELTGRENIFLNGTVLGMTKSEVKNRFDEIVDFSGVEKFIDTPVKRYSSGMYVRLAFAVAAHLETEIMIIDEVLAVGDAEFQKKCLGKMKDVSDKDHRTVLFVSHNMAAIKTLCSRCIVLKKGIISTSGTVSEGIDSYISDFDKNPQRNDLTSIPRRGNGELRTVSFHVENNNGLIINKIISGENVFFVFKYEKTNESILKNINFGFSIHNAYGDTLAALYSDYSNDLFEIKEKTGHIRCLIKNFPFSHGRYFIGVRVIKNGIEVDYPRELISFIDVENGNFYKATNANYGGLGPVLIKGEWKND